MTVPYPHVIRNGAVKEATAERPRRQEFLLKKDWAAISNGVAVASFALHMNTTLQVQKCKGRVKQLHAFSN